MLEDELERERVVRVEQQGELLVAPELFERRRADRLDVPFQVGLLGARLS